MRLVHKERPACVRGGVAASWGSRLRAPAVFALLALALLVIAASPIACSGTATVATSIKTASSGAVLDTTALRKGPYLMYTGDNTEMAVMWQTTETAAKATLEWGYTDAYGSGPIAVEETSGGVDGHLFRCDITGLKPGALVYYRVSVGGQVDAGTFRAAPATDADSASLYAISDTQDHPDVYAKVMGAMLDDMGGAPGGGGSILLHAGDLTGAGLSEQKWDDEFFTRKYPAVGTILSSLPVMAALGNHDSYAVQEENDDPTGNAPLLRKYWPGLFAASPGHFYYSFDYGPVHVAVLDTWTCSFDPASEEYRWLDDDLRTSTKAWKIVMLHNPIYSADRGTEKFVLIRRYLRPLFESRGVALVLTGHSHMYSRCEVGGITYLTIGGGGGDLTTTTPTAPYVKASAKAHHFLRLDIQGDTLESSAIAMDGKVLDSSTLSR
jgi:hypothetical protein